MPVLSKRVLVVDGQHYKVVENLSTIDTAPGMNGNPSRYFTTYEAGLDAIRNFFGGWYTSRTTGENETLMLAYEISAHVGPDNIRSNVFRNTQLRGGLEIENWRSRWVDETTKADILIISLTHEARSSAYAASDPASADIQLPPADYTRKPLNDLLRDSGLATLRPTAVGRGEDSQGGTDTFFDHTFTFDMAYNKEELKKINAASTAYYYDVVPEYSFLTEDYETVISRDNLSENLLPNIYAFLSEQNSEFRDPPVLNALGGSYFHQLITLNSMIQGISVDIISDKGEKIGEKDEGQYFKKYATTWKAVGGVIVATSDLPIRYSKTLIPNDSFSLMEEAYNKRNLFPMYNTIEFNTSTNTELVDIFAELKVNELILQKYISGDPPDRQPSALGTTTEEAGVHWSAGPITIGSTTTGYFPLAYKEFNIESFTDTYFNTGELFSGVVYGPGGNAAVDDMIENPLSRNILGAISKSKIKEIYKKYARSYLDILRGVQAHTEVIAYKITKTGPTSGPNTPLTEILISNSNKLELVEYIDTQVKYNTSYRYLIEQIVVVFGSKITFGLPAGTPLQDVRYALPGTTTALLTGYIREESEGATAGNYTDVYKASVEARTTPSIRVYTVPYAITPPTRIIDDPPCPPEILFIPYKGVDNKILINVNNAFGEYIQEPIIINLADEEAFALIEANQPRVPPGKVRFTGDDRAERFDLYRISHHPTSYRDFRDAELVTLQTSFNGQRGDCSAFVDDLLPNTKYYYIGRTVDYHGNLSNPTAVFRVELVSNDGIIYPVIDIVEFKTDLYPKKTSRTMRRYIQISPAYLQQIVSPEQHERFTQHNEVAQPMVAGSSKASTIALNQIKFGIPDVSSWGKSFKIRLTSRDTGRKIDINTTLRVLFDDD